MLNNNFRPDRGLGHSVWIVALLFSLPSYAELVCTLYTCISGCQPAAITSSSAGEACARNPAFGSASWHSSSGGGNNYKCRNALYIAVAVTCNGACEAPKVFNQELGQCIDPAEKPCGGETTTGHPISLLSGYKILPEVDYVLSGESKLGITRHYLFNGESGHWKFGYRQRIRGDALNSGGTILYIGAYREDGVEYYFHADVTASSTEEAVMDTKYAPFRVFVTFDSSSDPSGYVIQMPDGSEESYDGNGMLTELKSATGLVKAITYSGNNMLVTDNTSGLVLKYYFTSITSTKPLQVTKIEVKSGSSVLQTYLYDYNSTTALLEEVTYPDSTTIAYNYGENSAPATALTSKEENGTAYITWDYDGDGRANMSTLGSSGAEELNITYTANSTTGYVEEAEVENASGHTKTLVFKTIGDVNKLAHVDGDAVGSCAPADSYTTYDENNASDTYRQKETLTEGVDLAASNEGVVTRFLHEDSNWPHLVTTKITGLKWDSGAVKPWSSSGTFDPDDTDVQAASQKMVTEWHNDGALVESRKFYGPNSLTSPTGFNTHEYYRVAYTYDDGTYNCDGNSGFNSYRLCSITQYDIDESDGSTDDSRTWSYSYTLHSTSKAVTGLLVTDPSSQVSTYAFSNGQLTSVVLPTVNSIAQTTSYGGHSNNAFRLPETITDPNGVITALTYDDRGRVETMTVDTASIAAETAFTYYPNGLLQSLTQPDGSSLEYFYNSAHQLIGLENHEGDYIEYTPSLLNGQWTTQEICTAGDAASGCTGDTVAKFERVFDALGRLSKITENNGVTEKQIFGYDTHNNLTTRTLRGDDANDPAHDDNDLATVHEYDALNRLIRSVGGFDCGGSCALDDYNNYDDTVPSSPETEYVYNGQSLISGVTDAEGHTTSFTYNGFGELTQEDSPDRGTTTYVYDAAGNLITKTDARSKVTKYQYDNLNRLTGIDYGYSSSFSADVSYGYDEYDSDHGKGKGRLTSITDSSGSTDYKYDALGRIIKKTQVPTGTSLSLETAYAYNGAGPLAQVTYPDEQVVLYDDSNGRFTGVDVAYDGSTQTNDIHTVSYEPFGGITDLVREMENSDTLDLVRVYDMNGRLSSLTHSVTGGTPVAMAYGYDAFNNISDIDRSDDEATDQHFVYDPLQRLVTATGLYGRYTYTYDHTGNRITQRLDRAPATAPTSFSEVFTETYLYDGQAVTTDSKTNNRLESITRKQGSTTLRTRTFAHDGAGNTTEDEKVKGATTTTVDLIYGDDNRLHSVEVE